MQDPDYKYSFLPLTVAFGYCSIFVAALVICYFVLRFGFKKCVGPKKSREVTRTYRNISIGLLSNYNIYKYFNSRFYSFF